MLPLVLGNGMDLSRKHQTKISLARSAMMLTTFNNFRLELAVLLLALAESLMLVDPS